jgi:RNA polymerase-associated protein CTR9
MAAAIHTLDLLLQSPNPQRSIEAMVMLASIRAHPRPGVSSSDVAQEKAKARELFDRASKALEHEESLASNGHVAHHAASYISDDMDMHVEIARLWQEDSLERTTRALKEALRLSEVGEGADPRLLNNLGGLQHMEGNLAEARALYENALTKAASLGPDIGEGMSTSILYNLARVYEDSGDVAVAKEAYDKLLARHPEYVDGECSKIVLVPV